MISFRAPQPACPPRDPIPGVVSLTVLTAPPQGARVALSARPNLGPTPIHMYIPFEETFPYVPHSCSTRALS